MTPIPAPGTPCRPTSRAGWPHSWERSRAICRSTGGSNIRLSNGAGDRQSWPCIEAFLEALPQMKRQVFVRRYWYLSPVGEIAAQYGMSESKVTSMLFRLRRELKVRLEQEGILL